MRRRLLTAIALAVTLLAAPAALGRSPVGTPGPDRIAVKRASGALVRAGGGPDRVTGGTGPDQLLGDGRADVIDGAGGDDALDGGSGDDRVLGAAGDDTPVGGVGDDPLQG